MGYCAAVGAGRLTAQCARVGRTGYRLEPGDAANGGHRAGAGSTAAQATMIRMAEAPAGRLDVGLRSIELCVAVVVDQGIQAGQTGAGRQEYCQ